MHFMALLVFRLVKLRTRSANTTRGYLAHSPINDWPKVKYRQVPL